MRGELLSQLGRDDEARAQLQLAMEHCGNAREQAVLRQTLDDLRSASA